MIQAASATQQLNSVQYLRALAAILVTIAHASEEAKYFYNFRPVFETEALGKGVDIFFVISGFIIYYASDKFYDQPDAAKNFIINRFTRVIPLYYTFTTLMIFTIIAVPGGVKEAIFDPWQFITSYLFIPYERYDGRIAPILSLGWTLNYEMFFYLIFAVCLFLPKRFVAIAVIAILLTLSLIGTILPHDSPAFLSFWTNNIIIEFAFGIVVAVLYRRHGKALANWGIAVTLLLTGLILLYILNTPPRPLDLPRFILAGVPAVMMVTGATLFLPLSAEGRLPKSGIALGDSSYSLYLTHRFVQRPVQMIYTHLLPISAREFPSIYVAAAVIASILVGHLIFLMIESPLLTWCRVRLRSHKDRLRAAARSPGT